MEHERPISIDRFARPLCASLADELTRYWNAQQCLDRGACTLDMHVQSGAFRKLVDRVRELEQGQP